MTAASPRALSAPPSWSAALGILLLVAVSSCGVVDEPSCAGCHRDCGVLRDACHEKCDATPACRPDGGELRDDDVAEGGLS